MKKSLLIFVGCLTMAIAAVGFTACEMKHEKEVINPTEFLGNWLWADQSYYGSFTYTFEDDGTGYMTVDDNGQLYKDYFLYTVRGNKLTIIFLGTGYSGVDHEEYIIDRISENKVIIYENDSYYGKEYVGLFIRQ